MDKIGQSGLAMSLQERATELNNLASRANFSENEAEIVKKLWI